MTHNTRLPPSVGSSLAASTIATRFRTSEPLSQSSLSAWPERRSFPSPVNSGFKRWRSIVRRPSSGTFDQNDWNSLAINVQAALEGTELSAVVVRIRSATCGSGCVNDPGDFQIVRGPEYFCPPRPLTRRGRHESQPNLPGRQHKIHLVTLEGAVRAG